MAHPAHLKKPEDLRSARWFAPDDLRGFGHRSRLMQMGLAPADWEGKPCIGILNTWSDLNPCHAHFKLRVDDVKRGVLQAGGFPVELPALSVDETFTKPTSMLYRNMLAMEVEEQIRSHPLDGVVLMGGCDKTGPALVMGALSAGVPSIFMPAGPMLRGNYAGHVLGSGSDSWKFWDERRAGNVSEAEWQGVEGGIARSFGTCMTMGTASTMAAAIEAMGLSLPGASSMLAADAGHGRMAADCGRRIVEMVWEDLTPEKVVTQAAIRNALVVTMALGCSTNAVVHLLAIAGRAGLDLSLEDFDALGRTTPVLANIRPVGTTFLMEDFYYAGGLRALMASLENLIDLTPVTVSGVTVKETLADAKVFNDDVIRPLSNPIYGEGSLAILRGNLCPNGAVVKPAACDARFWNHEGPALVFDSYPEMKAMIDRDDLDVTEDTVLVLRNAGPRGGPGMPEWGMLPLPAKLVRQGVRDMLRISDARMSGTSYGACVLHVSPESHVGGPLALLKTGDIVRLDLAARSLDMMVDEAELEKRRAAWTQPDEHCGRGYSWMFGRHVTQADKGCDFDYLEAGFGTSAKEPSIF